MKPRTASRALLAALLAAACSSPPVAATPVCPSAAPAPVMSAPPPAALKVSVDDVVKELVAAYNAREPKRSFALMSAAMQNALPLDKEPAWIDGMLSKGPLLETRRVGGDGPTHGIYEVRAERGAFRFEARVDPGGRISGLQVKELVVPPPVPLSTLPLALPFKGEWLVHWGGDTLAVNAHVDNPSQRRAADLVKVDPEGKDHRGDGKKNSDHLCFGAEVLAAADGTVVSVVDGVADNEPGQTNPDFAPGNAVVIAHEGGVHSMYGHLQRHSLKVREGAKVKRGTVLGLCGNSGNSSQPHLHFQLQDGPRIEASWGVEASFPEVRLTRDGKTKQTSGYTFLKNDRIAPPR